MKKDIVLNLKLGVFNSVKEIKFRIYDEFNKSIYQVLEIDFKRKKVTALFRNFLPNVFDFDEVEFLPFVGLKDSNGKEIYEKDVLFNGIDSYEVIYDPQSACFLGKF